MQFATAALKGIQSALLSCNKLCNKLYIIIEFKVKMGSGIFIWVKKIFYFLSSSHIMKRAVGF